jgi:hypothetical protein
MPYRIPTTRAEVLELRTLRPDEALIATAIAGVIQVSRSEGKSLDDLTAELLTDDSLLDASQRYLLSQVVSQAWQKIG